MIGDLTGHQGPGRDRRRVVAPRDILLPALSLLALTTAMVGCRQPRQRLPPGELMGIGTDLEPFREAFNDGRGRIRFVALLSPG